MATWRERAFVDTAPIHEVDRLKNIETTSEIYSVSRTSRAFSKSPVYHLFSVLAVSQDEP
jgi:hypothetical protein